MKELAALEEAKTGKPAYQVPFEVEAAAAYFEFYGGLVPTTLGGETLNIGPEVHSYTLREPFGVVGVITPWNSPINQAARGIAPALAAGNVVVAKPSEFTSTSTLELARIALRVRPARGRLQRGDGYRRRRSGRRSSSTRRCASWPSPARCGPARRSGAIAADRILPLTLELGGKSPNLIFADADMAQAVPGALRAFVTNNGQVCSAGTRILVEKSVHDDFVAALAKAAEGVKPGQLIGPSVTDHRPSTGRCRSTTGSPRRRAPQPRWAAPCPTTRSSPAASSCRPRSTPA